MAGPLLNKEQKNYFMAHYKGVFNKEMAEKMNEKFGLNLTRVQVKGYKSRHHLDSGLTGHFPKGYVPANKGKHQAITGRMRETMFKKGNKPHNYCPVGTERIKDDGYVWIKVTDAGNHRWKQKNRIVYEKAYGPLPKGYYVMFLDGNRFNFNLENLAAIPRSQHLMMNQRHFLSSDPELTKVGLNITKLQAHIFKKQKERRKNGRDKD